MPTPRFQFSLRTLMIAVTGLSLFFGACAVYLKCYVALVARNEVRERILNTGIANPHDREMLGDKAVDALLVEHRKQNPAGN